MKKQRRCGNAVWPPEKAGFLVSPYEARGEGLERYINFFNGAIQFRKRGRTEDLKMKGSVSLRPNTFPFILAGHGHHGQGSGDPRRGDESPIHKSDLIQIVSEPYRRAIVEHGPFRLCDVLCCAYGLN
jgi:hypothetical protein